MARTGSTVRFLKQQLDTLGTQLRAAEDALRAYRERAGVVDAEEEARTQVRRLAQIEADRGAVEAERQALALLVQQMRSDSARARTRRAGAVSTASSHSRPCSRIRLRPSCWERWPRSRTSGRRCWFGESPRIPTCWCSPPGSGSSMRSSRASRKRTCRA